MQVRGARKWEVHDDRSEPEIGREVRSGERDSTFRRGDRRRCCDAATGAVLQRGARRRALEGDRCWINPQYGRFHRLGRRCRHRCLSRGGRYRPVHDTPERGDDAGEGDPGEEASPVPLTQRGGCVLVGVSHTFRTSAPERIWQAGTRLRGRVARRGHPRTLIPLNTRSSARRPGRRRRRT